MSAGKVKEYLMLHHHNIVLYFILSVSRKKENSSNGNDEKQVPTGESVPKEVKFKERSTPKITFRSDGAGSEVAFKKRKLNPGKKRNVRQTDPNKIGWTTSVFLKGRTVFGRKKKQKQNAFNYITYYRRPKGPGNKSGQVPLARSWKHLLQQR